LCEGGGDTKVGLFFYILFSTINWKFRKDEIKLTPIEEPANNLSNVVLSANNNSQLELILDFVSEIVSSLAWPIVVLIILFFYRDYFATVLSNIKSIKYGNAEATFEQELKYAVEKAKAIETPDIETASKNDERINELYNMASVSPTGAIIEAWKDIEKVIQEDAKSKNIDTRNNRNKSFINWLNYFVKYKHLPEAEVAILHELRSIRNRASHSNDFEISTDQARRYILLADRLIDSIKTLGTT